jgi:hypothetical protein
MIFTEFWLEFTGPYPRSVIRCLYFRSLCSLSASAALSLMLSTVVSRLHTLSGSLFSHLHVLFGSLAIIGALEHLYSQLVASKNPLVKIDMNGPFRTRYSWVKVVFRGHFGHFGGFRHRRRFCQFVVDST